MCRLTEQLAAPDSIVTFQHWLHTSARTQQRRVEGVQRLRKVIVDMLQHHRAVLHFISRMALQAVALADDGMMVKCLQNMSDSLAQNECWEVSLACAVTAIRLAWPVCQPQAVYLAAQACKALELHEAVAFFCMLV